MTTVYNNRFYAEGSTLSNIDIEQAIESGDIFITPYNRLQLQPSGYNLTPTRFFYSTKKKRLLPVHETEEETYVMIDKNDTVLVRTRETIVVSPRLSGAFYSKVKVVSQGFGHVSTTLDPEWEGQLLISLNNPTNKKIKFSIEKNVYGNIVYNSFVTVEFSFLRTPATMQADNMAGRLDILDETIEKNVSIFKRKEIEKFRELVEKLHECDKKKINEMVLDELDENELNEWKDVLLEKEKDVRLRDKQEFLERKREKYLYIIQDKINIRALNTIKIVNQYIERKQKCIPLRYKILSFLRENIWVVLNFTVMFMAALLLIKIGCSGTKDQFAFGMASVIIIDLMIPIIREIINHIIEGVN